MTVRRPMAALVAMTAALAVASPVAAWTYLLTYDQNGNGIADTWLVDDDGNTNTAERMLVDANENGRVELQMPYDANNRITSLWLDPNEDGGYEIVAQPVYNAGGALIGRYLWYDQGQDGRFEIGYYDGNLDGYYEYVCVDSNYDGVADFWTSNTAPRGRTATDDIARRIAAANWVNDMHARGLAVFFPTVSVPLP
jgi:hypothetical protein